MSFISPWSALVAAGIAVPLLLLLYFLKLRRRALRIPSTLLWQKSFLDLQVNTPFQKLRWSILLLLQLLLIASVLFALAEPVLQSEAKSSARMILLIDRSASMNATDGPVGSEGRATTRLADAQRAAREIVDRLGRSGAAREMMIIAFGAGAQVVSGFDAHRPTLRPAIDSIAPTDEQADLQAALDLAGAFAARREDETSPPPDVVLISDGGVEPPEDAGGFALSAGALRFVRVGPPPESGADNVGIVAFTARRDYEDPARVLLFARLVNAGERPVTTTVTALSNETEFMTRSVTIPPAASGAKVSGTSTEVPDTFTSAPGEATVTFAHDLPGGGLLVLRHDHRDALPVDDLAALVLPPPQRPRLAIVHPGDGADPFLRDLLELMEPASLRELSVDAFSAYDPAEIDSAAAFDLVIFDRVSPERLPGIPSITFGGVPAAVTARPPAAEGGKAVLSWRRRHPVLRHVALDPVRFVGFGAYDLPAGATPLAFGPDGPVLAVLRTRGARHVVVGFALQQSNWPIQVSFNVFMQNVFDYLTLAGAGHRGLQSRPGEPITVRARPGAQRIVIDGPMRAEIPAAPGAAPADLPALRRAGVYAIDGAVVPLDRIAVSVLSTVESDTRPRASLRVNASPVVAGGVSKAVGRDLWPWAVAAGLVLLVIEWLVYCHQLRR